MTIYALSSGPGVSGIAVIRISGPETSKAIKLLTGEKVPKPRLATLRKINKINTSELIDEGIILWFPGPESYTGEDMAEIQVHGSKAVIDALHTSISNIENCRLAEPGEFTKLAFQNGKINLLKAESVADLISSETEIQRQQAIKIMNGKSADQFNFLREKLLKILSHVEAKIDFPDEDLPNNILDEIKNDSNDVIQKITIERMGESAEKFDAIAAFNTFVNEKEARIKAAKEKEADELEAVVAGMEKTASGLYYKINKLGEGQNPSAGSNVAVHYRGMLMDGTVFDSSYQRNEPINFTLGQGQVIPGWDEGIALLNKGASAKLVIPSDLAYGSSGAGGVIPGDATLIFEVELVEFS